MKINRIDRWYKLLRQVCSYSQHKNKKLILSTEDLIISKNSSNIKVPKYCHAQVSLTSDYKQMLITCLVFIIISFVPIYKTY